MASQPSGFVGVPSREFEQWEVVVRAAHNGFEDGDAVVTRLVSVACGQIMAFRRAGGCGALAQARREIECDGNRAEVTIGR